MAESGFRFNDEQRTTLLSCWKRPRDREIAAAYLQDVERLAADYLDQKKQHPPTGIKQQIALANDLRRNAEAMLVSLDRLPQDFAKLINVAWLNEKYGDEYFKLHTDACLNDRANNTARKLVTSALVRGFAPDGAPPHPPAVSELLKLPPDYFKQADIAADFLRTLAGASKTIVWMLKGAKQWHNKEAEEDLLYSLALRYEGHFGKLPSAANQRAGQPESTSPFRKFLVELSSILRIKLGANIIRDVLGALKRINLEEARQKNSAQ